MWKTILLLAAVIGIFCYFLTKKIYHNTNTRDVIIATISGIVSGVIVGVFLLSITEDYNDRANENRLRENLEKVTIGISKEFCNQSFGAPIVSRIMPDDYYHVDLNGDGVLEHYEFTASGYKLKDCVLLCMFRDGILDAYVIVTQKEDVYLVRPISNSYLSFAPHYLLSFTYDEFKENVNWDYCSAYDSNEGAFYYYSEMTGGAHVDNYLYLIVGNYAVEYNEKVNMEIYDLVRTKWREGMANDETREELRAEIMRLRSLCKPNTFGAVNYLSLIHI